MSSSSLLAMRARPRDWMYDCGAAGGAQQGEGASLRLVAASVGCFEGPVGSQVRTTQQGRSVEQGRPLIAAQISRHYALHRCACTCAGCKAQSRPAAPPARCRGGRSEPPAGSCARRCPPPPLPRGQAGRQAGRQRSQAMKGKTCGDGGMREGAAPGSMPRGSRVHRRRHRVPAARAAACQLCHAQRPGLPAVDTSRLTSPARKRRRIRDCSCTVQPPAAEGRHVGCAQAHQAV